MTGHKWWNAFTRAWWKVGYHAHVDLLMARTICCQLCGQEYDGYEDHMQGHDISGWIKKEGPRWVIRCGYPSSYDLSEFWYLKDFPEKEVDGVCDYCIMRMLGNGTIMDSGKERVIG